MQTEILSRDLDEDDCDNSILIDVVVCMRVNKRSIQIIIIIELAQDVDGHPTIANVDNEESLVTSPGRCHSINILIRVLVGSSCILLLATPFLHFSNGNAVIIIKIHVQDFAMGPSRLSTNGCKNNRGNKCIQVRDCA